MMPIPMTPPDVTFPPDVRRADYDERFLERSSEWLRDPELRFLTDTPVFTPETQRKWFEGLQDRSDYVVWGIQAGEEPIGAFGLKHMTAEEAEYWGYIGDRAFWGRGIGQWMLQQSADEARARGLSRLVLRVIPENVRARRAYERFGFESVSEGASVVVMAFPLT